MNFGLTSDAARDFENIVNYYRNTSNHLASAFIESFDQAVDLILDYPEIGRLTEDNIRRLQTRGYPYNVYYTQQPHNIQIFGILHFSRNPDVIKDRIEQ